MPTPRKPTALKIIEGDRDHQSKAKKAVRQREPQPRPIAPDPPAWLDAPALAKWRELAGPLEELGVFTEVDGDVMAIYCQAYADHERLTYDLRANGESYTTESGYEKLRPEVALRDRARDDMRKSGAELGIGAASRTRIEVKTSGSQSDGIAKIIAETSRSTPR